MPVRHWRFTSATNRARRRRQRERGMPLRVEPLESRRLLSTTTALGSGGDWNDPTTWDNGVPDASADVVVPTGATVLLDGATQEAKTIVVGGTLEVVENSVTDKTLSTDWILLDGGLFRIGSELDRYDTNTFTLTLEGDNPTQDIPAYGISSNDAFVIARSGGSLQWFGASRQSWTQINVTATAGTDSITLKVPVNWSAGDEIVIASTTFDMNEAETRHIVAVSPDRRTLTLDAPLAYTHFGELQNYNNGEGTKYVLDERAEVGLLTHNVKIQGDADSAVDGIGGNLMFLETAGPVNIDGVEFYHMGQKARLGRYPVHWHMSGDREGDSIANSSIHNTFNRALTIHGAQNVLVSHTVAYDHIGHGYFLEDAVETGNKLYYNLGLVTREPQPGEELLPSDLGPKQFQISGPSTFWITNPNNDLVGNVAAGSQSGSGFWYALPTGPLGLSASNPLYHAVKPQETDLGLFLYNRAHSNAVGLDVDGGPDVNTGEPISSHYKPPSIADFARFTGYANSKNGVYFRGTSNIHLTDARLADNVQSIMFAFDQTISDSLIVGVSANDFGGETKHGVAVYDGPNIVSNVHFAGFNNPGAGLFTVVGAAERFVNHIYEGITFDDPNTPFSFPDTEANNTFAHAFGFSLYDADGSLTGTAGQSVIYDHPLMRSDGDVVMPGWQKAAVSQRRFGHLRLEYDLAPEDVPFVTITRSGGPGENVTFTDMQNVLPRTQVGAIMNTDFVYKFTFDTPVTTDSFEVRLGDAREGDYVYVQVDNPWEWIAVNGASVESSIQEVRDSQRTAYVSLPGGGVFLKVVVEADGVAESLNLYETTAPVNLVVDNVVDESDGNTGPGELSLREAIALANARPGFDEITFAPSLNGQTITLVEGRLMITDATSVDASTLPEGLTIDASGNDPTPDVDNGDGSEVFFIRDANLLTNIDVKLRSLTLTGADSSSAGGAIRTIESLTLVDSTIYGNATQSDGGAVNSLLFPGATLTIINSTISGNYSTGDGGGVWLQMADAGSAKIINSTITDNIADNDQTGNDLGGGLFVKGTAGARLENTIVAGNHAGSGGADDAAGAIDSGSVGNLIGADTGVTGISDGVGGNKIGTPLAPIDPLLGPLADNGGSQLTHALLPGSPAVDVGDPTDRAGVAGVPLYDQRGSGHSRVLGAAIDAGAYELMPLEGDGNLDGVVDGLDYILWASFYGNDPAQDPPGSPMNGDYTHDGVVDGNDYLYWAQIFSATLPGAAVAYDSQAVGSSSVELQEAVDQAFTELAAGDAYDNVASPAYTDAVLHSWRLAHAYDSVLEDLTGQRRAEKWNVTAM